MDAAETYVKASVPYPELTKIIGAGDYEQLNLARRQIRQNLAAIECPTFGGDFGCVALAFTEADYYDRFEHEWSFPNDKPPPYDPDMATNAGSVTRARREAEYEDMMKDWYRVKAAIKLTKGQIKKAWPRSLLKELEHKILGLNNVDIIDILQHSFDRRGKISDGAIEKNQERIAEPYDVQAGFQAYIERQEECHELAEDANDPYTDKQKVTIGQKHMVKTALVDKEYTEWKNLPVGSRSWVDFKAFWADVWSDYEDIQELTATEAGFGTANAAITHATAVTEALEGLANVAAVDKNTVEMLTTTNATLVEELKKNDEIISKLTADNSKLIAILAKKAESNNNAQTAPRKFTKEEDARFDPKGYCWSHGYRVVFGHNSKSCKGKLQGHKDEATRENSLGGSTRHRFWNKTE